MAQLSIASPVGVGCTNNRDDMTVVLDLLRVRRLESWYQGPLSGLALPSPTEGKPLEALSAAVKLFQAKVQSLATPDGIVSQNGATILFLGGLHMIGKQIIVDLDEQLLYAYEGTKPIYEFDCASGDTEHPTAERPALFEVLRKEKIYRSKKYDAQMNYALFFSADGKAIHQSNVVGLTSLLKKWGANYFGSHGCVAEGVLVIAARKLLVPGAAIALGFAIGAAWQRGRAEGRSEDIIGAEVALLEKHRSTPTCAQVGAATTGSAPDGDTVVHWRYLASTKKVQRLVVGPDLTTGYEEREFDCSRAPSN